jgi:hypothetical protein
MKKKVQFKSKSLPGLSKADLNELTYANLVRSEFMKEAHKDPKRKEISKKGGKIGIQSVHKWAEENPEEYKKMVQENGRKSAKLTQERGTGIFGLTDEERSFNAKLGGSTNSEAQQEARKKQFAEHFQKAGTDAAAEKQRQRYAAKRQQVLDLLNDDWYTVKQVENIVKEANFKRFNSRNFLEMKEYFESKKVKGTKYFKKVKLS